MFPTQSRVKLNRVALKDVVGQKVVPRRRRVLRSRSDVPAESGRQEREGSASVSVKDSDSGLSHSVTHRPLQTPGAEAEESCVGIHRNPPLSFTGLTGAQESSCRPRGHCKCVSPHRKSLGKQGQEPGKPKNTDTPQKISVCIDQYPKVVLCDIAKIGDTCSHGCPYLLSDILRTQVVHCFKRDMRAGFWFRPRCSGHNEHKTEKGCLGKKPEKSICRSESLAKRQPADTTCSFVNSRTNENPADCSASLLLGKHTKKGKCRTDMWHRDTEEDPRAGSSPIGAKVHKEKRIKLWDIVKDGSLPSTPNSECTSFIDTDRSDSGDKEKACLGMQDDRSSCLEHTVGGSTTVGSAVTENCVRKELSDSLTGTNAANHSPELFCQTMEVETEESFTCQRVRVYFRKIKTSCARTYIRWPFSKSDATLPTEPTHQLTGGNSDSCMNHNQPDLSADDVLLNALTFPSDKNDGGSLLAERNGEKHSSMTFTPCILEAKGSPINRPSAMSTLSMNSLCDKKPDGDRASHLSLPVNGSRTNSSRSTPSPTALGLDNWDVAADLSPMSSPLTRDGLSSVSASSPSCHAQLAHSTSFSPPQLSPRAAEKVFIHSEETQVPSCDTSQSSHSSGSSLLLPQDEQDGDEELVGSCPPELEPYYDTKPICHSMDIVPPPVLTPVPSPSRLCKTTMPHSEDNNEEDENIREDTEEGETSKHYMLPGFHRTPYVNGNDEDMSDATEQQCQSDTDSEDDEQDNNESDQETKTNVSLSSDVETEPSSSSSGIKDGEDDGSGLSERASSDQSEAEAAADAQEDVLDEVSAYAQDILLVDVSQEDPELFINPPQKSILKLGPARVPESPKRPVGLVKTLSWRTTGASLQCMQRSTPVNIDFPCNSPDIKEESDSRPWRPKCSHSPPKTQSSPWLAARKPTKSMGQLDANNNQVNQGVVRSQPIQLMNSHLIHISPPMTSENEKLITNSTECWRQKTNAYCRHYFSETQNCGFKMCRFQHIPMEGDEKFCIETVTRFMKNPMCLRKAGAVFIGYYENNPPGLYFSISVMLSLLWALLKVNMVSDVFLVLTVSLAHKIVPDHEFLLALFNFVRKKGLVGYVPELLQLTFKMVNAGLVLSLDCLDCIKNTPAEFQQTVQPNSSVSVSGIHKLSSGIASPEYLELAHAIVEIELCSIQEDWGKMGEVFRSICQFCKHPNQVERISGRIAIALLSEGKDKLSLPFAVFAETVCPKEDDNLIRNFMGRVGVSLMLRYHKTRQWGKGRKVVEVLSITKINYSTLKGLFGNENGASRCFLITVAAELFLLSGSVEGALNTLRENAWFLCSSVWPCEPADLESRSRVLIHLAERTSHRDSLEILCNLPGLKEANDLVDISRYLPLFNSHLQLCVDRQTLPVASDTVDLMLSKSLEVDHTMLQTLLHKLGKQNHWLRAREIFSRSMNKGYYPGVSAPPGFMALNVPSRLGEVELALTFEMFITVNATAIHHLPETTSSCLSITLKRNQACESEYLSAGSRLLSAACIPQPKLIVHYKAVNSSQEQVFTLDISSARCWLRHNHLWANEMWTH